MKNFIFILLFVFRLQQELAEQKKAEDKARRAEIFQAYKIRKQADDEEPAPPSSKPQPSRQTKPR